MKAKKRSTMIVLSLVLLGIFSDEISFFNHTNTQNGFINFPQASAGESNVLIDYKIPQSYNSHGVSYNYSLRLIENSNDTHNFYDVKWEITLWLWPGFEDPSQNFMGNTFLWQYGSEIHCFIFPINFTVGPDEVLVFQKNYTFSAPQPIETFEYIQRVTGRYGLQYRYSIHDLLESNPVFFVPSLNDFTYKMTVMSDRWCFNFTNNVFWPNTTSSQLYGLWTLTADESNPNNDTELAESELRGLVECKEQWPKGGGTRKSVGCVFFPASLQNSGGTTSGYWDIAHLSTNPYPFFLETVEEYHLFTGNDLSLEIGLELKMYGIKISEFEFTVTEFPSPVHFMWYVLIGGFVGLAALFGVIVSKKGILKLKKSIPDNADESNNEKNK